jgi:hypothetical protein
MNLKLASATTVLTATVLSASAHAQSAISVFSGIPIPLSSLFKPPTPPSSYDGQYAPAIGEYVDIDNFTGNYYVTNALGDSTSGWSTVVFGYNPGRAPSYKNADIVFYPSVSGLSTVYGNYTYAFYYPGLPHTPSGVDGGDISHIDTALAVETPINLINLTSSAIPGVMRMKVDLTPSEATNFLTLNGYTHFNWLQTITGFSYNGVPTNVFSPYGSLRENLTAPTFDPPVGDDSIYSGDDYPPYYDEGPNPRLRYSWSTYNTIDEVQKQYELIDSPNLVLAGWSAYYSTSLIGVRSDGSYDILSDKFYDPDLTFRWEYTQTADMIGGGVQPLPQNLDPSLGGGGIVTFLGFGSGAAAAPEPSTWAMLFIGFAGVRWIARRVRSQSPA